MRRVLFVAYHFPPDAEIGSVRPYQFARHLPELGFEPWVLTVRPEFAESFDPSFRVEGIPDEHVIRTSKERTARDVVLDWRRRARPASSTPRPESESHANSSGATPSRRRLREETRDGGLALLAFPDKHIGWRRPAVRAAQGLMSKVRFDAVVSSSPPAVTHFIARALARRHRVPWVMDFRDPWSGHANRGDLAAILGFLQLRLFRRHAGRCDAIVANTERLRASLTAALGRPPRNLCIPNGFDRSLAASGAGAPQGFAMGYFGQIMGGRDPRPFLRGLRLWIDRGGPRSEVRVRFVGSGFEAAQRSAAELELLAHIRFEAPVPRHRVPDLLAQQYVLLLIATHQPLQLPGKVYEYLAAGRRILAITEPDGATADFLAGLPGCVVASTPEGAADALERFWCEQQAGGTASIDHSQRLDGGTYLQRTRELAALLEEVIRTRDGLRSGARVR